MTPLRPLGQGIKVTTERPTQTGIPITPSWVVYSKTPTGILVATLHFEFSPQEVQDVANGGTLQLSFFRDEAESFALRVLPREPEEPSPYPSASPSVDDPNA